MQRLRIRYRKSASDDLARIHFYLIERGAAERVASDYVQRIRATCRQIGDAPEGGRSRDDLAPGLRMWSFERRATITYRIDAAGVQIVNVFHRGRDIATFYAARSYFGA